MSGFEAFDPGSDLLWTVGGILDEEMARNFVRGGEHVTEQVAADGSGQMMRLHPDERRGLDTRHKTTRKLIKRYDSSHNKTQYDTSGNVISAWLATGDQSSKGDLYYGAGALSTAGVKSLGYTGHRVVAGLAKHVQDANDGNGERVLSDHAAAQHHIYAYTGVTQKTHTLDTAGHTLPAGHRIDDNGVGNFRLTTNGSVFSLAINTAGGHVLDIDKLTYNRGHQIGNNGGHMMVRSANNVQMQPNNAGQTHTFDSTGLAILGAGHRLDDDGSLNLRLKSASTTAKIEVQNAGAKQHVFTSTTQTAPTGHVIDTSSSSKIKITTNGTVPAIRSDSHSVVTSVISFGSPTTVGPGASTPVGLTSGFANSDYMFKAPGVTVWNVSSGNPGIYGMNQVYPTKNGGLGGGYWNGGVTLSLLWASTFVNVDGSFEIYLNNVSGSSISVNMAVYYQTVNN